MYSAPGARTPACATSGAAPQLWRVLPAAASHQTRPSRAAHPPLPEPAYPPQAERGVTDWNPELDEEFEDRQGNVMNRKTYADLARQGLLD